VNESRAAEFARTNEQIASEYERRIREKMDVLTDAQVRELFERYAPNVIVPVLIPNGLV
jgi:hypothetical protein